METIYLLITYLRPQEAAQRQTESRLDIMASTMETIRRPL